MSKINTAKGKQQLVVQSLEFSLPSNLDLDSLLKNHPPSLSSHYKNPQAVKDRLILILAQLGKRIAFNKGLNLTQYNGFVCLNAQVLQNISVRNYNEYIHWIVSVGIWECDGVCIPGVKSFGYKWNRKYAQTIDQTRHTVYDKSLVSKLQHKGIHAASATKYPDLESDLKGLTVDLTKAISDKELMRLARKKSLEDIKDNIRRKKLKSPYHSLKPLALYSEVKLHANRKVCATNRVIQEIQTGGWYFKQDSSSRRLHTNITSLKSEMRPILKYAGQDLTSLDIKNSQPYMSLALLNKNPSQDIKDIIDEHTYYLKTNHPSEHSQLQKLLGSLRSGTPAPDIIDYINEVTNGTLYDTMKKEWNKQLATSYTRAQAKEQVFRIFFQPPHFKSKEKAIFSSKFPTIWKLISLINRGFTTVKSQRRANKVYQGNAWALILQNIESHLVLDVICPRIKSISKAIPLFTIHDSIATTDKHVSLVEQEMKKELLSNIGYSPTLKHEPWS